MTVVDTLFTLRVCDVPATTITGVDHLPREWSLALSKTHLNLLKGQGRFGSFPEITPN